jgi:hypothetical protein
MRKGYPGAILFVFLLAAMLVVTACGGGAPPKAEPAAEAPVLDEIRLLAETALDASLSTDRRQQARTDAMVKLLALLRHPDSTQIAKVEWEQKVGPGEQPLVRYFEAGRVRVYGLALPGSGIVPPGERVVIQYVSNVGAPTAHEVEVMPGGQLAGVVPQDERSLLLVFSLARGGGYLGHYVSESRTGEYQPDPTAWRGVPQAAGDVRLEASGKFLMVDVPVEGQWRPQFDPQKHRFYVNADLGLEWTGKYTLVDDRSFTAFEGFLTAAKPGASMEVRSEAWEKAVRKLPTYLSTMESLSDDMASKLPPGSRVLHDDGSNLAVTVVSIPAPEGVQPKAFTVVRHRAGGGLPQAQVVAAPGVVDAFHLVEKDGVPGLILLSGGAVGGPSRVMLLRVTGANDWVPAPDWYGFLPEQEGLVKFTRPANTGDLVIEGAVSVEMVADGSVQVCSAPAACFSLNWVNGRLSGAGWVSGKLKLLVTPTSSAEQVEMAADVLRKYLTEPETVGLTAAQVVAALPGAGLRGWDMGGSGNEQTRAFSLPYNGTGVTPLVIQAGRYSAIEYHSAGAIQEWTDVRLVLGAGSEWIVALGRSPDRAAVVLFRWNRALPANALSEPVAKTIGEWSHITYTPGQTSPVRGLYVTGRTDLRAEFLPDGTGVALCEGSKMCTTYRIAGDRWVLE